MTTEMQVTVNLFGKWSPNIIFASVVAKTRALSLPTSTVQKRIAAVSDLLFAVGFLKSSFFLVSW